MDYDFHFCYLFLLNILNIKVALHASVLIYGGVRCSGLQTVSIPFLRMNTAIRTNTL